MTFIYPREYECDKCGFTFEYSPSYTYTFLPVSTEGKPFCHQCLINFLTENVPIMKLKVD